MKKTLTTVSFLLTSAPAFAHDGAHIHPHGFGEAILLVIVSAAILGAAFWFGRGGK